MTDSIKIDHILLIGYGSPGTPAEVVPYLKRLGEQSRIPAERLLEVRAHYEAIGGASPYNRCVFEFSEKLAGKLSSLGKSIPVFAGMKNWKPYFSDALAEISSRGLRRGLGIVLTPHRSFASFDSYVQALEAVRRESFPSLREYRYLPPWYDHPLFIEAHADEIAGTLDLDKGVVTRSTPVFFSSHSIPAEMAEQSHYERQILYSASLIAQKLNHFNWSVVYQSRSGSAGQRWLEPDVLSVIRKWRDSGERDLLFAPLGFLCENAEILYDLDIEVRREVESAGMVYRRARTVMNHPKFFQMMAELSVIELSAE